MQAATAFKGGKDTPFDLGLHTRIVIPARVTSAWRSPAMMTFSSARRFVQHAPDSPERPAIPSLRDGRWVRWQTDTMTLPVA